MGGARRRRNRSSKKTVAVVQTAAQLLLLPQVQLPELRLVVVLPFVASSSGASPPREPTSTSDGKYLQVMQCLSPRLEEKTKLRLTPKFEQVLEEAEIERDSILLLVHIAIYIPRVPRQVGVLDSRRFCSKGFQLQSPWLIFVMFWLLKMRFCWRLGYGDSVAAVVPWKSINGSGAEVLPRHGRLPPPMLPELFSSVRVVLQRGEIDRDH